MQQKIPHVPRKNIMQHPHCGASQKVKNGTRNITTRLCADLNEQGVWFTIFTNTIVGFLSKNLTKEAKSDKISEAILDINFTYDSTSNFITKVAE